MSGATSRRTFLKGASASAGLAIVGFSSSARAWVGHGHRDPFDRVPRLDGELVTDAATRAEIGQDLGNLVVTTPAAVLRPGSIDDVVRMVRFCRRHCIQVAAKGQGHSSYGQSQVDAGLVIDMRTLSTVHDVGDGYALVDGGSTWRNLLESTLPTGQSPVLTGYQGLSVGGTLSMGGVAGMAYKRGVQVDNVEELTVVTGRGNVEVCSRRRNRPLFDAVLAGIGQYGIIVRAKLRLYRVGQRTIDWTLRYDDRAAFFADMRTLVNRQEIDLVYGGFKTDPVTGAWFYELYTAQFYDGPSVPDMPNLHRGLAYTPGTQIEIDGTYLDFHTRVDGAIAFLSSIGVWDGFMRPWFDVFLPQRSVEPYVASVLPTLAPDDVGPFGFVLIFPLQRRLARQPLFRLPDDEVVYLFDILTTATIGPGFEPGFAARTLARNRTLYEQALSVGGTRYPIGAQNFSRDDWRRHYGPEWVRVNVSKTFFDPDGILTPGPGIFDDA